MTTRTPIANQGEVRIDRLDTMPECATKAFLDHNSKGWIVSHSEQGHHHILAGDCEVMERTSDVPAGARILYAIVKEPTRLFQDAAAPHAPVHLAPGIYEMRIKREFDPFAEQARAVRD